MSKSKQTFKVTPAMCDPSSSTKKCRPQTYQQAVIGCLNSTSDPNVFESFTYSPQSATQKLLYLGDSSCQQAGNVADNLCGVGERVFTISGSSEDMSCDSVPNIYGGGPSLDTSKFGSSSATITVSSCFGRGDAFPCTSSSSGARDFNNNLTPNGPTTV